MHPRSGDLAKSELFRRKTHLLSWEDRVRLSYERARAVAHIYDLNAEDILHISPKFWQLQVDPILTMDDSLAAILMTQLTLCAGALATLADGSPRLDVVCRKLIDFEISGMFCLAERDHGFNTSNVGTCAVMHPDGSFDLWTPYDGAAKLLPPFFSSDIASEAIVFARLAVGGEDRGIKPFLVPLHDGSSMSPGITTKQLSSRGVIHSPGRMLAHFSHVHLPPTALLAAQARTDDVQDEYLRHISRATASSLSLAAALLPVMRVMSYVVGKYSCGKMTIDPMTGLQRHGISLSTQYIPIMTAIAHTFVSMAFADSVRAALVDPGCSDAIKNTLVIVLRSVVFDYASRDLELLGERCGARGLLEVNGLYTLLAGIRGSGITEEDTQETSFRFAIDLVLGKVSVPPPKDPTNPLAQHATFLASELRSLLPHDAELHGDGGLGFLMNTQAEASVLPLCVPLIQAIGHRMAYDSAVEASIDPVLVDIYLADAIISDPAWYSEAQDPAIRRSGFEQTKGQVEACTRGVTRIEEWLDMLGIEPYVPVATANDRGWDDYVEGFESFGGDEDEYEEFISDNSGDLMDSLSIDAMMTHGICTPDQFAASLFGYFE